MLTEKLSQTIIKHMLHNKALKHAFYMKGR